MALRNFMSAVNRPEPALWITLAAIPINGVLAYALIYGAFGAPQLDMLGAGLATTLVNVFMCAVAIWIAYTRHPFKKYRVLGRFWRFDWQLFRQLLVIGLPISGSFLLEYGLFAAAALLMGSISTSAIAAHQIALQTAADALHGAVRHLAWPRLYVWARPLAAATAKRHDVPVSRP